MKGALFGLLVLLVACDAATQYYTVNYAAKTSSNPQYNIGYSDGYFINGEEAPVVNIVVGDTAVFTVLNGPIHPFYICTNAVGENTGEYDTGVTGNFAYGGANLTFTPQSAATLYYQCEYHSNMGWIINVTGSSSETSTSTSLASSTSVSTSLTTASSTTGKPSSANSLVQTMSVVVGAVALLLL